MLPEEQFGSEKVNFFSAWRGPLGGGSLLCGEVPRRPPPPLALIFAKYGGEGVSYDQYDAIRKREVVN